MRGGEVLCDAKLIGKKRILVQVLQLYYAVLRICTMNKWSQSIKLWYFTSLLHGVWWAGWLIITEGGFSLGILVAPLIAAIFGAIASAIAIPCAVPLFAYALSLAKSPRLIALGVIIPALWGLSTIPLTLIPSHVPFTINSFLSYTLPALGAAYIAAAYVYRPWLFRQ